MVEWNYPAEDLGCSLRELTVYQNLKSPIVEPEENFEILTVHFGCSLSKL